MRAMKDSGVEWIGEIPEKWELHPAKLAFSEVKEKNTDGKISVALQFKNGEIIRKTNFDADSDDYVADTILNYTIVVPNIIMINGLNLNYDFKTQRVGLVKETGVITSAYLALKPDENMIIPEFAKYLFKGYESKMAFHNMGAGIRLTLGFKEFKSQPVLFPDLCEQCQIVSFLDRQCAHIDNIIEKTKASIEEYKKLRQAVITQAVTKGVRGERLMKDSGIEWIGEIPEEWGVVKLKRICIRIGDGLHSTPEYDENGVYYFLNGNNIGRDMLIFKENTDRLNEAEYLKYKPCILTDNTILITLNGATYGKTSFYNGEKVLLGKSAGYITLKKGESKRFVRYYLASTPAKTIMDLSLNGTTIANLSLTTLNGFVTPLPEYEEQQEIAAYLDEKCAEIDALITKKEQFLTELESYKKSMIYEHVTGKKEVPQA